MVQLRFSPGCGEFWREKKSRAVYSPTKEHGELVDTLSTRLVTNILPAIAQILVSATLSGVGASRGENSTVLLPCMTFLALQISIHWRRKCIHLQKGSFSSSTHYYSKGQNRNVTRKNTCIMYDPSSYFGTDFSQLGLAQSAHVRGTSPGRTAYNLKH